MADTWNEAVDKAVDLSLKWRVPFRVRRAVDLKDELPFRSERLRVMRAAMDYIELKRDFPKSIKTEKALTKLQALQRKLALIEESYRSLQGTDVFERNLLNHPVKAFRTDL